MLPLLSHIENIEGLSFWLTTDGTVGCGFEVSGCDPESENPEDFSQRLLEVLRLMDSRILSRIKLKSEKASCLQEAYPRAKAMNSIGFTKNTLTLYLDFMGGFHALKEIKNILQKKGSSHYSEIKALIDAKSLFERFGIEIKALDENAILALFNHYQKALRRTPTSIETGSESIGILRLTKQPLDAFSQKKWLKTLTKIPKPFELSISFQKMEETRAKILLQRILKQTASAKDIASNSQSQSTESLILHNFEEGMQIFEIEALLTIARSTQKETVECLKVAHANLSLFCDWRIETFGVAPSFVATLPGSYPHVSLLETDEALSQLLPLVIEKENKGIEPKRSLTLLRSNETPYHFDLFIKNFNAFNTLIIGPTGRGKSVLTGLLTTSLLNDENIQILKLDVGGSHSKETELYKGEEYRLRLDQPSNLNPFRICECTNASDSDKIAILSKFLSSLIQEVGESTLSNNTKAEIETSVSHYLLSHPQKPSLDDFYEKCVDVPRRKLLARWVKGGIYENAFKVDEASTINEKPRLQYYNFSEIFQAADPEFAKAGIAGVLAEFNTLMLSQSNERLVLICDEVPFFINHCFEFFKFTTANVRKYGHAVILISQVSNHLVVGGDTAIIENSPQRFLFSNDGEEETFKERLGIDDETLNTLKNLKSIPGQYSEVLLQTSNEELKLNIKVTPGEYWRVTTSKTDKEKLTRLLTAVPGLTLQEGIKCLSKVSL